MLRSRADRSPFILLPLPPSSVSPSPFIRQVPNYESLVFLQGTLAPDRIINRGTIINPNLIDSVNWIYTFQVVFIGTDDPNGQVTVFVPEGTTVDTHGNTNVASDSFSVCHGRCCYDGDRGVKGTFDTASGKCACLSGYTPLDESVLYCDHEVSEFCFEAPYGSDGRVDIGLKPGVSVVTDEMLMVQLVVPIKPERQVRRLLLREQ